MDHPNRHLVVDLINKALQEDIASGDITSRYILTPGQKAIARLVAKEDLILCGTWVFEKTFLLLEPMLEVSQNYENGQLVKKGEVIATIKGLAAPILAAERTALNFIQRMSGIATYTNQFVRKIEGTKAVILDTRKTLPGFRILDKFSVKTGGGRNHRFGLFDMVLIKENHIASAGGISKAVHSIQAQVNKSYKIEVEVKNIKELQETLKLSVDRILLDNMTVKEMKKAVDITSGKTELEASGNISLANVKEIAETGVDYISIGALTHSAKAADLSLLVTTS